jgi:hypothetical protein
MAAKLERPPDMVLLIDELPHVDAEEVLALLQSTPPELGAVYEGVDVGCDIMLFMPIAGLFCCCEKVGLPIPGLAGLMAGKEELRDEKLLLPCGADRFVGGGGETGGVDHEKVAGAGEALLDRFAGREGRTVEEEAEAFAEALAHESPPSMSDPPLAPALPRTKASKFVSSPPFVASKPVDAGGPPKLMNSLRVVAVVLLAPSSCSFLVCSCSMRDEVDLINAMYAWNCGRLSKGPKLNCHRIGSTSMARKSLSTWGAMALKTSCAAI